MNQTKNGFAVGDRVKIVPCSTEPLAIDHPKFYFREGRVTLTLPGNFFTVFLSAANGAGVRELVFHRAQMERI